MAKNYFLNQAKSFTSESFMVMQIRKPENQGTIFKEQ